MMDRRTVRHPLCGASLFAACLWLGGCAGPGGLFENGKPPFRDPALAVAAAKERVVAGQSRKADVMAALGPASVVRFDSGYEVWAYRAKAERGLSAEELVILFEPSGVVKKARVRPPYPLPAR